MLEFFKSVLDTDRAPVVLCDLEHRIVYMNPAAVDKYSKYGDSLVGGSLFNCHNNKSAEIIEKTVDWFKISPKNNMIYTYRNSQENKDVYMVALRDGSGKLIGYYEKHEYRNKEAAALYDYGKSLI